MEGSPVWRGAPQRLLCLLVLDFAPPALTCGLFLLGGSLGGGATPRRMSGGVRGERLWAKGECHAAEVITRFRVP